MENFLEQNLWGHSIPGNGTPFEEVGVLGGMGLVLTVLVETYLWYNLLHRRSTAIA